MITNDNSRKEIAPEEHTEYLRVLSEHTIEGSVPRWGLICWCFQVGLTLMESR